MKDNSYILSKDKPDSNYGNYRAQRRFQANLFRKYIVLITKQQHRSIVLDYNNFSDMLFLWAKSGHDDL